MRLICPNCGAQYEVPDDVVPEAGRDVQCSNCGDTWFQPHPDQDVELAQELERALPDQEWQPDEPELEVPGAAPEIVSHPEPTPEPEPEQALPEEGPLDTTPPHTAAARRGLDPAIADVLRQEAEHEARARDTDRDTTGGGLESQPDLGLEEPETDTSRRAREARMRMSRLRGEPSATPSPQPRSDHPETEPRTSPEPETAPLSGSGSRGDILPDVEEINSTLRSTGDRKAAAATGSTAPAPSPAYRRGRGFRSGFGFTLVVAAVAILAYVNADRIVEMAPQSKPAMVIYVTKVNEARYWLDTQMVDVMLWLDEKAIAAGGEPSNS